jgi:hypothetical protein
MLSDGPANPAEISFFIKAFFQLDCFEEWVQ